jgi:hypothetical protein
MFGLQGSIILLVPLIGFGFSSYCLWRSSEGAVRAVTCGRDASLMILVIALASTADCPLRAPKMLGILARCTLWFLEDGRGRTFKHFHR